MVCLGVRRGMCTRIAIRVPSGRLAVWAGGGNLVLGGCAALVARERIGRFVERLVRGGQKASAGKAQFKIASARVFGFAGDGVGIGLARLADKLSLEQT